MHKIIALSAAVVTCVATMSANAATIQYSFHAQYSYDQNTDNTPNLFANGAIISGTFIFDPAAAAVATNLSDFGNLANYGLYSIYGGAIQQLAGQAGGHAFSAISGSTLVANSPVGSSTMYDGVFNIAGNLTGSDAGTGFNGFSINEFALKSFNLFSVGGQYYLPSQALPGTLGLGPVNTGIQLIFEDGFRQRIVSFSNVEIAAVPIPAAGWLFGAALAGLLGTTRKTRR